MENYIYIVYIYMWISSETETEITYIYTLKYNSIKLCYILVNMFKVTN